MPNNINCYVEWEGLEEFIDLLQRMEDSFVLILLEEYTRFGMKVEEGAKALAPEDSGDLASSINFTRAVKVLGGVEVSGGSNMAYALRRHEEPYRGGVRTKYDDGAKYEGYYVNGRGLTTRGKSWMGYPAGRKYMENAIKALEGYYNDMLERILTRVMSGGI